MDFATLAILFVPLLLPTLLVLLTRFSKTNRKFYFFSKFADFLRPFTPALWIALFAGTWLVNDMSENNILALIICFIAPAIFGVCFSTALGVSRFSIFSSSNYSIFIVLGTFLVGLIYPGWSLPYLREAAMIGLVTVPANIVGFVLATSFSLRWKSV
jgi:hypothetical protein